MKKIMFNDHYGLTQAVLEGRKTQTRRVIPESTLRKANLDVKVCGGSVEDRIIDQTPYCFREKIAVAQAYKHIESVLPIPISDNEFEQRQAYHIYGDMAGWNNKLFVRADLMPHRIKITNVRVERLQDISEEDCLKEGFEYVSINNNWGNAASHWEYTLTYEDKLGRCLHIRDRNHKEAFSFLIDKICGTGTWDSNPYVFVYDFELIK